MASLPARAKRVFLNVPYDPSYERIFIALLAAVVAAGKVPHCTLEVPAFHDRRKRIFDLIERCALSIHDITLEDRLNMPFELGFACAVERHAFGGEHRILVLSDSAHQAQVRLSDLNGKDVHGHGMNAKSAGAFVLGQLRSSGGPQPTKRLDRAIDRLAKAAPKLAAKHHAAGIFERPVFEALRYAAVKECERAGLL